MRARVTITPKAGVLDPQGQATLGALHTLGFDSASHVRQGKIIDLTIETDDKATAHQLVADMCEKLLANTVIENYSIELD